MTTTFNQNDVLTKRIPTVFLQAIIVLFGIGALAFLLWEPHVEGVNANAASLSEIYFDDPFLAVAYLVSVAFFVALYQAFRLLSFVRNNTLFSQDSVRSFGIIKYCALIIAAFAAGGNAYLVIVRPEEDIAGGVAMSLFIILVSAIVAATAAMFGRIVQNAVDKKLTA